MLGCGLLQPVSSFAQTSEAESPESKTLRAANVGFDLLVLRTSGLITSAAGTLLCLPAAAIASPAGGMESIREAVDIFVLTPGRYTFERRLGDF